MKLSDIFVHIDDGTIALYTRTDVFLTAPFVKERSNLAGYMTAV